MFKKISAGFKRLRQRFFNRKPVEGTGEGGAAAGAGNGLGGDDQPDSSSAATGESQTTAGPNGSKGTRSYAGQDITDEQLFVLLAGVREDDFIAEVLAAIDSGRLDDAEDEPVLYTDETAGGTATAVTSRWRRLFESFEPVKRMRRLDCNLSRHQEKLEEIGSLESYESVLHHVNSLWDADVVEEVTKDGETDGLAEEERRHRYYTHLKTQLQLEIAQLRSFFHGSSQPLPDPEVIPLPGVQEKMKAEYEKRRDIRNDQLEQLKKNVTAYSIENAHAVYEASQHGYSVFLWNCAGLTGTLLLTTIFLWYLLSNYVWLYLPAALLFAVLLLLVPARGLQLTLYKPHRTGGNSSGAEAPGVSRATKAWLLIIDLIIPLSIVAVLLLVNWPQIEGDTASVVLTGCTFFLLLALRAGAAVWMPRYQESYTGAQKKLQAWRAFVKHRRLHKKELVLARLDNYTPMAETEEEIKKFMEIQEVYKARFLKIVEDDRQSQRRYMKEQLEQYYADRQQNFENYYTHTHATPFLEEISDAGTVRRLLARLEYLFYMAVGSRGIVPFSNN